MSEKNRAENRKGRYLVQELIEDEDSSMNETTLFFFRRNGSDADSHG